MIKIAMAILLLFAVGCITSPAIPRPSDLLDCRYPQGRSYTCYSDDECAEYMSGYSAVFTMKVEEHGETHPIIHMNLFADHTGLLLLGRIEGEMREGRWYMKMWTIVCGMEDNILSEDYSEGFRKEKP